MVKATSPTAYGITFTVQKIALDIRVIFAVLFDRSVSEDSTVNRRVIQPDIIPYRCDASRAKVFLKIHKLKARPSLRITVDNGEKGWARKAAFLAREILAKMGDQCSRESRKGKDCKEGKEVL